MSGTQITWPERITVLSVHPHAATPDDVARLAAELMDCRHELCRLQDVVGESDAKIIGQILNSEDAYRRDELTPELSQGTWAAPG